MTKTKKFSELTVRRPIKLLNRHIAILANNNIDDLDKFIQNKIDELEPMNMDSISNMIAEETENVKTTMEAITNTEEIKEDKDINIF